MSHYSIESHASIIGVKKGHEWILNQEQALIAAADMDDEERAQTLAGIVIGTCAGYFREYEDDDINRALALLTDVIVGIVKHMQSQANEEGNDD